MSHKSGEVRKCLLCGKERYVRLAMFNRRTFCSVPCYMEYRRKFQNGRAYVTEKNPFEGRKHSQDSIEKANKKKRELYLKFGSPSKGKPRLDMLGDKNPNWAGGISPRVMKSEWKKLRKLVLSKYNNKCCFCKQSGVRLHVHHIVPYRICLKDEERNLIPLCGNCHTI